MDTYARIKEIKDDETKDIDDRVWIPEKIKQDIFVNIKKKYMTMVKCLMQDILHNLVTKSMNN